MSEAHGAESPVERTVWGEGIARLLTSRHFPQVSTRLERGYHFGPEDGEFHVFIKQNYADLRQFYDTWNAELIPSGSGYYYLLGDEDHFRGRRLTVEDMIVGMALATVYLSPERLELGGVEIERFIRDIERLCGSRETFLSKFAFVRRLKSEIERLDMAAEAVHKSLRTLRSLGFVDLTNSADGTVILNPRQASLRFAEPSISAGAQEEEVGEAVQRLVQGRILEGPEGARAPGDDRQDRDSGGEDDEEDKGEDFDNV